MEDLNKVSSIQLFSLWKNLSIGLLTLLAVITFSKLLPFYLSPVIAVVATAIIYTVLYNNRTHRDKNCQLMPYATFFSLISYSFVTIIVNVLWVWGIFPPHTIPAEFIFFNNPFIPALYLCPCCFVTMLVLYIRRHKLSLCKECKIKFGDSLERGKLGTLYSTESQYQIKNLTVMFGLLSAIILSYYFLVYNNIDVNARDWYIFLWITVIFFVIAEVYFVFRYYNIYLDLKENNELITDAELQDMTAKTYVRFYVVCGDSLYVDTHSVDPQSPYKEVTDTPFFTKRTINGISVNEVRSIIERMTGITDGELRFFFGRKSADLENHSILRYFYFIDPKEGECPAIKVSGEWMPFNRFKSLYANNPGRLAQLALADLSRLATIMLTEKIFDENGYRKNKLKSYSPSFTLEDVRKSDLDFQDDKWVRISMFNSDTNFYSIKKWWRGVRGIDRGRSRRGWNRS